MCRWFWAFFWLLAAGGFLYYFLVAMATQVLAKEAKERTGFERGFFTWSAGKVIRYWTWVAVVWLALVLKFGF